MSVPPFERLERLAAGLTGPLAAAAVLAMVAMVTFEVTARSLFNAPVQGVAEIVANSIVAIVFLQVAHALMTGRMTRTDILTRSPIS